jgi:undecaprenyl diphosphate synthase
MQLRIPKHIAIIMDGNGRWAKKRGKPRIFGHAKGVEAAERTIQHAKELGIPYVTLYAFSTENWKRPKQEVDFIMELLREYLKNNLERFKKEGIRIRFIGRRDRIPAETLYWMEKTEEETRNCGEITVFIAVDYGGRDEIVRAVNKLLSEQVGTVDQKTLREALDLPLEVPDPDLLIRTGGEMRISNFLLWYIAYTELYFTPTLWPDFDKEDLLKAIEEFSKRERRFGGLTEDGEKNN